MRVCVCLHVCIYMCDWLTSNGQRQVERWWIAWLVVWQGSPRRWAVRCGHLALNCTRTHAPLLALHRQRLCPHTHGPPYLNSCTLLRHGCANKNFCLPSPSVLCLLSIPSLSFPMSFFLTMRVCVCWWECPRALLASQCNYQGRGAD